MDLFFLDTETGGLDPRKHSLLSVGLVHWRDGAIGDTLEVHVAHDDYVVTAGALKINNIDLAKREDVVPAHKLYGKLGNFIADCLVGKCDTTSDEFAFDRITVLPVFAAGHNVSFDLDFLSACIRYHGYGSLFNHRKVDINGIIQFLVLGGKLPESLWGAGLEPALNHFGIEVPVEKRHTALGDALATAKLFNAMLAHAFIPAELFTRNFDANPSCFANVNGIAAVKGL